METPQYLRKALIPMHADLRLAGLLPPLDAPHHLRATEWALYREGVVLNSDPASGSYVDIGLDRMAHVAQVRWAGSHGICGTGGRWAPRCMPADTAPPCAAATDAQHAPFVGFGLWAAWTHMAQVGSWLGCGLWAVGCGLRRWRLPAVAARSLPRPACGAAAAQCVPRNMRVTLRVGEEPKVEFMEAYGENMIQGQVRSARVCGRAGVCCAAVHAGHGREGYAPAAPAAGLVGLIAACHAAGGVCSRECGVQVWWLLLPSGQRHAALTGLPAAPPFWPRSWCRPPSRGSGTACTGATPRAWPRACMA
jgi:hypothetical protein